MKINPITLSFCGPHKNLEKPFIGYYHKNNLKQIRWGLAAASLFSVLFGFYDLLMIDEGVLWYLTVRWGVLLPTCLVLLVFTFSDHYLRCMQPALCLGTLIFGICCILMTFRSQSSHFSAYLFGLIQVLFFVYTFLRIRFIWSVTVIWLLLVVYLIIAVAYPTMDAGQLYSSAFFLVGLNLMGMMANYAMEFAARKNYYLSRQLTSKKRHLATVNRFLENRVAKRTSQLTQANDHLIAEIQERSRTENALRESEVRYRQMVNNVSEYICVHDLEGRIIEVNQRMVEGLGYAEEELVNSNIKKLNFTLTSQNFDDYLNFVASRGKARGTIAWISPKGQEFFLEYSSVLSDHPSGRKVVYSLARDITEARRTAIALAESQTRFKEVFETAAAGMMIVDVESQNVVEINLAAARMFGEPVEHLINRCLRELMQPVREEGPDGQNDAEQSAESSEWWLISKTDGPIPILKSVQPIEFGGRPHLVISFSNIQKIKEAEKTKRDMEAELMRSQHLQAIGTLAGGIAHDFNNILQGIIGYTQLAMEDAPASSPAFECLDEILQGGRRAKDLIAQILAFSRRGEAKKQSLNPTSLVKEALRLIRASIPATIDIRSTIGPDIPTVVADTTQIHQVVMNLCTNAAYAMQPQGGQLCVSLTREFVHRDEETPYGMLVKGIYLKLSVQDNGKGMPKEIVERIFEPFFTTKPQGEGTGMGLSTVLGIVQSHAGALRVDSEPGRGTCFEIYLPADTAAVCGAVESEIGPPMGSERILLVDDEKQIVQIGHHLLTRLGYKVQTCQDPRDALALFKRSPHAFDLVITDLAMPKIKGTTLIRQLRQIRSDIPIILCTGNVNQISIQQQQELGIREILAKPILRDDLARAVRRAMMPAADDFYPLVAETA